jgi:hypothetical protein
MSAEARGLGVFAVVVLALWAGCALLGSGGKVRVRNQTAATPVCRITVGNGPGSDYRMQHIDPGQSGDVAFSSGAKAVCVYACEQGVGFDRSDTAVMGCQDLPLDGKDEIVVFDGPAKPDAPPTTGYRQALWENNVNPVFKDNRHKPWLTPYGQLINGWVHVAIEHPGVCPKSVHLMVEDRKAKREHVDLDPKAADEYFQPTPPVWVSFSLDPSKPEFPRAWDLPTGSYKLRVRDDCQGVDLVDQQYPDGASGRAKPAGGAAP